MARAAPVRHAGVVVERPLGSWPRLAGFWESHGTRFVSRTTAAAGWPGARKHDRDAGCAGSSGARGGTPRTLVRHLDPIPPRAGGPRATRSEAGGSFPSGHHPFLPAITRWSRWKDRKKKIDWPLFPGYCFARFDQKIRLSILKCSGVVRIVSFDGEPAPVPEHEIEGIRRLVESELQYDPCPLIREGTMVEVVHGPLSGVVGRLVRKGAHARLILSVDLIG